MSDRLVIAMTSSQGVVLNTKGKYCDKDIVIVPQQHIGTPDKLTALINTNFKNIEVEKLIVNMCVFKPLQTPQNIVIKLIKLERKEE